MIDLVRVRSALGSTLQEAAASRFLAAVSPDHRWRRLGLFLLLSAALILATVLTLGLVVAIVGPRIADAVNVLITSPIVEGPRRLLDESVFIVVLAVSLSLLAAPILIAASVVYRRGLNSFVWPGRRFDRFQFAVGFVLILAVVALLLPFGLLMGETPGSPPVFNPAYPLETRLIYAGVMALMLLIAAAAEEITLRSVALQITAGFTRRAWLICLINGLMFSAMHMDPDPVAFVARALSGMVWAWAALRLGGIEFAVGCHWANNLFIALFLEPFSRAAQVGQAVSALYLLPELVSSLIVILFVERMARTLKARTIQAAATV